MQQNSRSVYSIQHAIPELSAVSAVNNQNALHTILYLIMQCAGLYLSFEMCNSE